MEFLPLEQIEKEKYEIKTDPVLEKSGHADEAREKFLKTTHAQMEKNREYMESRNKTGENSHMTGEEQKKQSPQITPLGETFLSKAQKEEEQRKSILIDCGAEKLEKGEGEVSEKDAAFLKNFLLKYEVDGDGDFPTVEDEENAAESKRMVAVYTDMHHPDRTKLMDAISGEYIRIGRLLSFDLLDIDYLTDNANFVYMIGQRLMGMEHFLSDHKNQSYFQSSPERYQLMLHIHDLGADFCYLATRFFEGQGVNFADGKALTEYNDDDPKDPYQLRKKISADLEAFRPVFEEDMAKVAQMSDEFETLQNEMKQKKEGQKKEGQEEKAALKEEEKKEEKEEETYPFTKEENELLLHKKEDEDDTECMVQVKETYKELLKAFHEPLPKDLTMRATAMAKVREQWDIFDVCCQVYINTHSPWTKVGKERLRLVKRAKQRMIRQFRSFATYQEKLMQKDKEKQPASTLQQVFSEMEEGQQVYAKSEELLKSHRKSLSGMKKDKQLTTLIMDAFCMSSLKQTNVEAYGYFADNALAEWLDEHMNESLLESLIMLQIRTAFELNESFAQLKQLPVPKEFLQGKLTKDEMAVAKHQYATLMLRGTGSYRKYVGIRSLLDYVFTKPNRINPALVKKMSSMKDAYLAQCNSIGLTRLANNVSLGERIFSAAKRMEGDALAKETGKLDTIAVMERASLLDWQNEMMSRQNLKGVMDENALGYSEEAAQRFMKEYRKMESRTYAHLQDFGALRLADKSKGILPVFDPILEVRRKQEERDRMRALSSLKMRRKLEEKNKKTYKNLSQEEKDRQLAIQLSKLSAKEDKLRRDQEDKDYLLAMQLSLMEEPVSTSKPYQFSNVNEGIHEAKPSVKEISYVTDKSKEPVTFRTISGRKITVYKFDEYKEPKNFEEAFLKQHQIVKNIDVDTLDGQHPIKKLYLKYAERIRQFRIAMNMAKKPEELVYDETIMTSQDAMANKNALLIVPGKNEDEFRFYYENLTDDEKKLYDRYHAEYRRLALLEEERDKVKQHAPRQIRNYSHQPSEMEVLRSEYEQQAPTSNDCWSCAGAGILNYFTAQDPKRQRISAARMRGFRPKFVPIAPGQVPAEYNKMKEEVERITVRNQSLNRSHSPMGNPYQLADFFLGELAKTENLKNAAVRNMTFNVKEANIRRLTGKDTNAVHNLKAKFKDVIHEALSGGSAVAMLVGLHYVTVVGMEGDTLMVHNSSSGTPGTPQPRSIDSVISMAELEGNRFRMQGSATIELTFLQRIQDPSVLSEKYRNLEYNAQTKRFHAPRAVTNAENISRVNGVEGHLDRMDMEEDVRDLYSDSIYVPQEYK